MKRFRIAVNRYELLPFPAAADQRGGGVLEQVFRRGAVVRQHRAYQ